MVAPIRGHGRYPSFNVPVIAAGVLNTRAAAETGAVFALVAVPVV